jgi:hypothetical protein
MHARDTWELWEQHKQRKKSMELWRTKKGTMEGALLGTCEEHN